VVTVLLPLRRKIFVFVGGSEASTRRHSSDSGSNKAGDMRKIGRMGMGLILREKMGSEGERVVMGWLSTVTS
jgi:hypothetical protein